MTAAPSVLAGSTAAPPAPGAFWRRWARWLVHTADGRSVLVLLLLPVGMYVLPALVGHPAIGGDNAIQNFPLRVLAGDLLRQGHLPLWNPYIWSGSPLLGGLNAGALYPLTFAFVVLPPVAAWVVNLLVVYWAAGLGLYALARQFRLRPLACLLAALSYSLAGAMSGQLVHLGVVQGMGWIPLLVLAQLRLSWAVLGVGPAGDDGDGNGAATGGTGTAGVGQGPHASEEVGVGPPTGRANRAWPWVALLAAMVGLVFLTGEPRSMAEAEVVATVVTLWLVLRPYGGAGVTAGRRLAFLGLSALAAVWGAALAAVQLLPGWSFINASQRASETYAYYGTGSLHKSWTVLLLVPDLFGGDGLFGQPPYFNSYNLPEVTGYIGLLPLVAALALLTRSFGRRRDRRSSDWGLWLALAALGILLAWGDNSPLGHLFVHIPLFGKTRLQSRNLGIVDLALAVLLAFWAHRMLGWREGAGDRARWFDGWRRWVSAFPPVATIVLCLVVLTAPVALEERLGADAVGAAAARQVAPWFVAQLVISLAVVALLFGWRRLLPRWRPVALTTLLALDLFLFLLGTSTGLTAGRVTLEPTTAAAAAVLGHDGRFAIYDTTALNVSDLSQVGQPDLNAFTKLPSVQGYGSILSATYGSATGSHTLDTIDPCALADGVFTPLRLATLLTLPQFIAPGVTADGQAPTPPAACPGAPADGTAHRRTLYLGFATEVTAASLVRVGGATDTSGGHLPTPRVGILGPTGRTTWPADSVTTQAGSWSVRFAAPQMAAGLVVTGPASSVSDTSIVDGTDGGRWAFDGLLQQALGQTGWRYTGNWTLYGRFVRTSVRPPVWVVGSPAGASVTQVQTTDWGSAVDRVTTASTVTVVRSEAYMPGWRVQAVPAGGGPPRRLTVNRVGLIQGVRVPPGRWTLTFLYRPPGLTAGLAGSVVAVLAFVACGAVALLHRRRRKSGRRRVRA